LKPPAAAECGLKAVTSRLLDDERNPCVCMGKEDNVGIVDLDELKEIGDPNLSEAISSCVKVLNERKQEFEGPEKVWSHRSP